MREPFRSKFRELIQLGAAAQDIHDASSATGYAINHTGASDAFVTREIRRVETHQNSLAPLLERFVGRVDAVLDVGCSTGGTTIALALSPRLAPNEVVGIDPNRQSIEAARVRAQGYDLPPERVRFEQNTPGQPLAFPGNHFDLIVSVSVLEFVSTPAGREFLIAEMVRVARPGGFLFLATPTSLRLREYHSRRLLGHLRHRDGYPWSSSPRAIRRMFAGCEPISLDGYLARRAASRYRLPGATVLTPLVALLRPGLPWQKFLFRKPAGRLPN